MSDYFFTHKFSTQPNNTITGSESLTDIEIFTDEFITITYRGDNTGANTSQWFSFEISETSDLIVLGLIDRTTGVIRLNDNEQAATTGTTYWVNDSVFSEPFNTWQINDTNVFACQLTIIQDTPISPNQRSYIIKGVGRQSNLARQPASIFIQSYRIS